MTTSTSVRWLPLTNLTPAAFSPYGQVIRATPDGHPFGPEDAQLQLDAGIPRFYIMQLEQRELQFETITRHQRCTQCLGSLGGQSWLMAVAPPSLENAPDLEQLKAFRIPGDCFIKMEVGTWHAGPYFESKQVSFYNLELSNTNIADHDTCDLAQQFGFIFGFLTD